MICILTFDSFILVERAVIQRKRGVGPSRASRGTFIAVICRYSGSSVWGIREQGKQWDKVKFGEIFEIPVVKILNTKIIGKKKVYKIRIDNSTVFTSVCKRSEWKNMNSPYVEEDNVWTKRKGSDAIVSQL